MATPLIGRVSVRLSRAGIDSKLMTVGSTAAVYIRLDAARQIDDMTLGYTFVLLNI